MMHVSRRTKNLRYFTDGIRKFLSAGDAGMIATRRRCPPMLLKKPPLFELNSSTVQPSMARRGPSSVVASKSAKIRTSV